MAFFEGQLLIRLRKQPHLDAVALGYCGSLIHDGYAAYRAFWRAIHQQCVAHLLKRCHELLEVATGGAVRFPREVKELLQRGLAARDRYFTEELTIIGLKRIATGLTQELSDLVRPVKNARRQRTLREVPGEPPGRSVPVPP